MTQVEGSRLEKNGWISEETWFLSTFPWIELKKHVDVSSTLIGNNNTNFFPITTSHGFLKATYCDRSAR